MFNTVIAMCVINHLYVVYIVRSSAKCMRDAKLNISPKAPSQHLPQNKSFQYSLKSRSEIFLAQTMESVLNYELNKTILQNIQSSPRGHCIVAQLLLLEILHVCFLVRWNAENHL